MNSRLILQKFTRFSTIESSLEFLLENNIIKETNVCPKCSNQSKIKIYSQNGLKRVIFRCTKKGCQNKTSILSSKLCLNEFLFTIYGLLINLTYYQIKNFVNVSDPTIPKIRKILQNAIKTYSQNKFIALGGMKVIVECDETVLSRRGIIRNPTSMDSKRRDTVWILGVIDNTNERNFFIERITERTVETISRSLENKILLGSIFTTDGYPSYPR
ncbi:hypothetical protein H311_04646, partial [Anncaliia algerae PRA109]